MNSKSKHKITGRPTQQGLGGSVSGITATTFEARATPVLPSDVLRESIGLDNRFENDTEYARFFDEGDELLHTILSVVHNSPTCSAIIRQKVSMCLGAGLEAKEGRVRSIFKAEKEKKVEGKKLEELEDALLEVNSDSEAITDVLERVLVDYITLGNAYIGMARTGEDLSCYHEPFQTGRLRRKNKEGVIEVVGFCADWKNWNSVDARNVAVWPLWSTGEDGIERTVIHLKEYTPGFDYYGLPDWVSGLSFAGLEYMAGRWNQSKIENRYAPSGTLQFFGAATQEEAQGIVDQAKKAFTGLGNNGGLLIQVLQDDSLAAKFTPIETPQGDGEFLNLLSASSQAIITAHRWTNSLAGVATAGQMGSNQTVIQEYQFVQANVIAPIQKMMLDKFLNVFVSQTFQGVRLDILNATPISFFGDIVPATALTRDEMRGELGFDPDETQADPNTDPNNPNPQKNGGNNTNPDTGRGNR